MQQPQAIIIDDHPLVRMTIKIVLEEANLGVVAESGDGLEAQKLVAEHNPEILIIDIDIPKVDGIEVVKALRRRSYSGVIIMISGKNVDYYTPLCIAAGANGFVSKKKNLPELISAINAGLSGYTYFPLKKLGQKNMVETEEQVMLKNLSSQEFRVFQLLVDGFLNGEIALKMSISSKTVSTYKTRLMEKLRCSSVKELYDLAKRNNLESLI